MFRILNVIVYFPIAFPQVMEGSLKGCWKFLPQGTFINTIFVLFYYLVFISIFIYFFIDLIISWLLFYFLIYLI